MDYSLVFDLRIKLKMSVEHLATGSGSRKDRLKNIFVSYLLPLDVRKRRSPVETLIAEAIALATSRKDDTGKLGTLHATLSNSGWQTDQKIACKLFEAYELASKAYYQTDKPLTQS